MLLRTPHAKHCLCLSCRPLVPATSPAESGPDDLPALLPGGLTPTYLAHRFCHGCLAITKHNCPTAPRASCLQCGATYSHKAPASPHGAALWASAQSEIVRMVRNTPPVRRGRIIPAGGVNALLGITHPVVIPD